VRYRPPGLGRVPPAPEPQVLRLGLHRRPRGPARVPHPGPARPARAALAGV